MNWLVPPGGVPNTKLLSILAPELHTPQTESAPGVAATAVAVWQNCAGYTRGEKLARSRGLPLLILDHGLLATPFLPERPMPILSLTGVESRWASGRSGGWAETTLATVGWETTALLARARAGMATLVRRRVGGVIAAVATDDGKHRPVLVDASRVESEAAAEALLQLALDHHDAGKIRLMLDPDARLEKLRRRAIAAGCAIVSGRNDSWSLLDGTEVIFTCGGPVGLLGLIAGRRVYCAAETPYSGWGLTQDAGNLPARPRPRSLEEVFAATCLEATRYVDPFHERTASFEETAALLSDWRDTLTRNAKIACCFGIDFWKRDRTRDFFLAPNGTPEIAGTAARALALAVASGKAIAYWPQRKTMAAFEAMARSRAVTVTRIEDGFIRSVGLGTNLVLPASIVADSSGIYYDPTRPSDLETILSETEFDPALLARAEGVAALLVDRRITKYNLAESAVALEVPEGRRRILVPGQFEDDKSVLLGGAGIKTNEELLRRVRAANPEAFIVYKPHPDVESGHRKGIIANEVMTRLADAVVRRTAILSLIEWADEIHTLTSQTGFEALLRGRKVVTYGQPYYAGWGLTVDQNPVTRRRRRLTLPELIAGTLILYPRYVDPVTRLPCGPEIVIDRIADPKTRDQSRLSTLRQIQGAVFAAAKEWAGRIVTARRR